MSFSTINQAYNDSDLRARVDACANQEARNNPELGDTWFGRALITGTAQAIPLYWSVAVATEAAYASAMAAGRGAPGHDTDVITDGDITAAVQTNWPPDPTPAT